MAKKQINKKKIEFSKIVTAVVITIFASIAVWSMGAYYTLVKLAIQSGNEILPDATLPVTCITTILGAVISYCLYQFGLKANRNKYGIDEDGQPFEEKVELRYFPATEEEIEEIKAGKLCYTPPIDDCSNCNEDFPEQTPNDCERPFDKSEC